MKGRGVGEDVLNTLKYVKNGKLISKGLGIIPHPVAQVLSKLADMGGLGKKRKVPRRRPQRGAGVFSDLGGGIGSAFGGLGSGIGSIAHGLFGAGKRRTIHRRRVLMT